MSRNIINDHLWTESEVAYQLARNRKPQVEANRNLYGPGGELEGVDDSKPAPDEHPTLELDKDIYDHVVSLDVDGLKSELRGLKIQPKGDEQELKVMLAQALQGARDANSSE